MMVGACSNSSEAIGGPWPLMHLLVMVARPQMSQHECPLQLSED